jgi:hypothetical protein
MRPGPGEPKAECLCPKALSKGGRCPHDSVAPIFLEALEPNAKGVNPLGGLF